MARSLLGRLLRREDGAAAVMAGLSLTVMLGFGALAVDASNIYLHRTLLQNVADSGARAAVRYLPAMDVARERALLMAQEAMPADRYGPVVTNADIVRGTWDIAARAFVPNDNGNAVRVTARRTVPLSLAAIFGMTQSEQEATAIAMRIGGFDACILGLQTLDTPVSLFGNTVINMPQCGIASNASMVIRGNARLDLRGIYTVLNYSESGNVQVNLEGAPIKGPPLSDPYAGLAPPGTTGSAFSCSTNCPAVMSPGVYSNKVTLNSDTQLLPGTYVFLQGMTANGTSRVSGTGVTIAFQGDVRLTGNSRFDITAPLSGPYAGVAFYGVGTGADLNINASQSSLNGAVYVPNGTVAVGGNGTLGGCSQVVAGQVVLHGTPSARQNCASVPLRDVVVGSSGALVG